MSEPAARRATYEDVLAARLGLRSDSPATEQRDRTLKLATYGRAEVRHAWLVNPDQRLLEVLRLGPEGWVRIAAHRDDERVRAEPFDAVELELGLLWADVGR